MPKQYPKQQRDRAVFDWPSEYLSLHTAGNAIGPKVWIGSESFQRWTPEAQADAGTREGPSSW